MSANLKVTLFLMPNKSGLIIFLCGLLLLILFFHSCKSEATRDKLNLELRQCDSLGLACNVVELRQKSINLMTFFGTDQNVFLQVRYYYIKSFLNEYNHNYALQLIDEAESLPYFSNYPTMQLSYLYLRSVCYMQSKEYNKGIKSLINVLGKISLSRYNEKSIHLIYTAIIRQLADFYIISGHASEGLVFFIKHSSEELSKSNYYTREWLFNTSYLAKKCDHDSLAIFYACKAMNVPVYNNDSTNIYLDYVYQAMAYEGLAGQTNKAILAYRKALSVANKSNNRQSILWIQIKLGRLYSDSGRLEEAMSLYDQLLENYEELNDTVGLIQLYSELAHIYTQWNFLDEAKKNVQYAFEKLRRVKDPNVTGGCFLVKYQLLAKKKYKSEFLLTLLDKADSCFKHAHNEQRQMDVLRMRGMELTGRKDSLNKGVKMLRYVYEYYKKHSSKQLKGESLLYLAEGLIRQRNYTEGEWAFNESLLNMKGSSDSLFFYNLCNRSLDYYIGKGDAQKVLFYTKHYYPCFRKNYSDMLMKNVVIAHVKFQAEEKEKEVSLLTDKLRVQKMIEFWYLCGLFVMLALVVGIINWIRQHHKLQEMKHLLADTHNADLQKNLDSALEELCNTNQENQRLKLLMNNINGEDDMLTSTTYSMLIEKDEAKFRKAFNNAYPLFLYNLHKKAPLVTRGDELLCMLMILKHSGSNIASILGVSNGTVYINRHRLRKKLNIATEDSLEDFIASLLDISVH